MKTEATNTPKGKAKKTKAHSFSTANNICALATNDMTHIGKFYGQVDAKARLDNYFAATGHKPTDKKLVFGQLFGVAMVQQLLDFITAANAQDPAGKQLTGIRVYNAMSVRPDLPAPDNTTMLPDVVLLPVYDDGTDIFNVHDAMGVMAALSGGMPCPNECGTGFYLQ